MLLGAHDSSKTLISESPDRQARALAIMPVCSALEVGFPCDSCMGAVLWQGF